MHILRPHPRPVDSETVQVGPSNLVLASPPSDSDEVGGPLDEVQRRVLQNGELGYWKM